MIARSHSVRRTALLVGFGAFALGACAGDIGGVEEDPGPGSQPPGAGAPGGRPAGSGGQTPGAPGSPMAPGANGGAAACKARDPGPSPMRRLTRWEYDNTIRDLLGDASRPAQEFPPEERVAAFDNHADGQTVPPRLAEGYFRAAERVAAAAVSKNLAGLVGCDRLKQGDDACAQQFITTFGRRAYRRPVPAEEVTLLSRVYAAGKASGGFEAGIRLALTTMLQSPWFLYRVEAGVRPAAGETVVRLDSWEMASRLSYMLWGSMPDDALLTAAAANKLGTSAEIAAQAKRMLEDPRARSTIARFHEQWLEIENLVSLEKDRTLFPAYGAGIFAAMKEETARFVDHVFWQEGGDLQALLTAPYTFADGALAKYYGLSAPAGTGFQKVPLDGKKRAGVLTQGLLVASHAKANSTNPTSRGRFVREKILCTDVPPPPVDVPIEFPAVDPKLTTRERFDKHRTSPSCNGCHVLLDPIGLAFENLDAAGGWRDLENGKPIDASGQISELGADGAFVGAVEMAKKLAAMPAVKACVTNMVFEFGFGRPLGEADGCTGDVLRQQSGGAAAGRFSTRDLLLALTETDAFQFRRVTSPGGSR